MQEGGGQEDFVDKPLMKRQDQLFAGWVWSQVVAVALVKEAFIRRSRKSSEDFKTPPAPQQ